MKVVSLLVFAVLALSACSRGPEQAAAPIAGDVIGVPDGDSLVVRLPSGEERVRLIGVNAPEQGECYGREAAEGLRALVAGRTVELATDVEPRDQYGRLLAYVYVDGKLVNQELAGSGLVLARRYRPNDRLQERLETAAASARSGGRGLWGACTSPRFSEVTIHEVRADAPGPDAENLNGEWVVIRNPTSEPVTLEGWTVRDGSSVHRFRFPETTVLVAGGEVTVSSGCGEGTPDRLFWCADGPVWDNSGDSVLLLDENGLIVAILAY